MSGPSCRCRLNALTNLVTVRRTVLTMSWNSADSLYMTLHCVFQVHCAQVGQTGS